VYLNKILQRGIKMAKAKRGKNIKKPGWRGTCPLCSKTGVKLLWVATKEDKDINVCRLCGK